MRKDCIDFLRLGKIEEDGRRQRENGNLFELDFEILANTEL